MSSITKTEELQLYTLVHLLTDFSAFAIGVIGVCKIVGNIINSELLIGKQIECIYYLDNQEHSINQSVNSEFDIQLETFHNQGYKNLDFNIWDKIGKFKSYFHRASTPLSDYMTDG